MDVKRLQQENKVLRELCEAQEDLLICYRLGNTKRAGKAIDRIAEAKAKLEALSKEEVKP